MNITENNYWKEIDSLASSLVDDAIDDLEYEGEEITRESIEDLINDSLLHETIDGHQWVIYYAYNDDVLRYTSNGDAYEYVYGNEMLGELVKDKGIDSAKMMMAYFAMYADVQEQLGFAVGNKFCEEGEE